MLIEIYGTLYSIDKTNFSVSCGQREYMDNQICKLTNLRVLNLQVNKIEVICKEIGNLTKLKILYLNNNLIEVMPREIGKLVELKELYLNYNKIKVICKEIGKLKQLCELTMNNLKGMSLKIKRLTLLRSFYLPDDYYYQYSKRINKRSRTNIRCLFSFE